MKLDLKGLLAIVVVVAVISIGAYSLGVRQASQQAQAPQTSAQDTSVNHATQVPASHPPLAGAGESQRRFSHFRVGNSNVKGMAADDKLVWVGTSIGVLRYDIASDDYELFNIASGSLLSNGVFHVSLIDDKVMVGTYGGGLSVYDRTHKSWRNYNIPDGLADQFVYDVHKTANGDLWIATWSGANRVRGGKLDDPASWQTFNVENTGGGLPNDWVYGVEEGPDGALWFATEQGLARFHEGEWRNWQHEDGLGAPLAKVKDDIRFSSDPGAASKHHARQKDEQGLGQVNVAYNPNYVVSLAVDAEGKVWAGTWGGGLARFDGETFTTYTSREGLPSNHIFMLYLDPQQRLWAGTSHGLALWQPASKDFKVYRRADGLFADNVFSMTMAADDSAWIGSFGGVARIKGLP